jgi:hypothetical protein
MQKYKEITPAIVVEAERLLAEGAMTGAIAERLEISDYAVKAIANDDGCRDHPAPPASKKTRHSELFRAIDASTIRRVQQMLAVGQLNYGHIARELGICSKTVSQVAAGEREAVSKAKPALAMGEKRRRKPIVCRKCRTRIQITPCRACHARLMKRLRNYARKNIFFFAILKKRFTLSDLFVLLVGTFNHFLGGPMMPDLMPFLSAEISALLSTKDKREAVIVFAENFFDQVIKQIDLPGPDAVIDPILRATIRPLVGKVYDRILQKLEVNADA